MSAYEKVANMYPHKIPGNRSGAPHERRPTDDDCRRARPVRGDRLREIRNKCPLFREVPQPGSYRLRRHFPRLCNLSTRAGHPYRPSILRRSGNGAPSPTATGSAPSGCNDLLRRNPERTDTILSPRRFLTYFRPSAGEHLPGRRNPETCTTSLPSSRPGSDPWRPSRGTGYG